MTDKEKEIIEDILKNLKNRTNRIFTDKVRKVIYSSDFFHFEHFKDFKDFELSEIGSQNEIYYFKGEVKRLYFIYNKEMDYYLLFAFVILKYVKGLSNEI